MKFEEQKEENGIGMHYRPSLKTDEKMRICRIEKIKEILNW